MGVTFPLKLSLANQTLRSFCHLHNMGPGFYVLLLLSVVHKVSANHVPTCIKNCGQCKRMLGPYFKGQACAESCLESKGLVAPDCNNPITLRAFLQHLF